MTAPDPPRAGTSPADTGRPREDRRGPTSYFQRVLWRHDAPDQPVVLWAEVSDGWEVRKTVWQRARTGGDEDRRPGGP